MARSKRDPAQVRAEKAHRERTVQVQVRFTKGEMAEIDAVLDGETRPHWLKAQAMIAARVTRSCTEPARSRAPNIRDPGREPR